MSIQKITRKDGSTRYLVRWYDLDGRQRGRAFPALREARQYEAKVRINPDAEPRSGSMTLSDYAVQWLARPNLRVNTVKLYRSHLDRRILPVLGQRRLNQIRRGDVQRLVTGMARSGDYSPATTRTTYAVVRACLADAVRDGLIPASPCREISQPEKAQRDARPLTPEQVQAIIAGLPPRYQVAGWVAIGTGMRVSEVLGLTVDRITWLPKASIRVDRQLQDGQLVALKTGSSRRTIPLDKFIARKVSEHLARWPSDGLLITSKVGKPVRLTVFEGLFREAVRQAGLQGVVYHDFRKTYGSLLVRAGFDVLVVAARLGHSDPSLTLSTYAGLWPEDDDLGRGAVESAFAGTPARQSARGAAGE